MRNCMEKASPLFINDINYLKTILDTVLSKRQLRKDINSYLNSSNNLLINCKRTMPYFSVVEDVLPGSVNEGKKNSLGLLHMIGNVAELVQEENIIKGGSWIHDLEDCRIENKLNYTAPTCWIGFRCVCEVLLKTK